MELALWLSRNVWSFAQRQARQDALHSLLSCEPATDQADAKQRPSPKQGRRIPLYSQIRMANLPIPNTKYVCYISEETEYTLIQFQLDNAFHNSVQLLKPKVASWLSLSKLPSDQ